MITINISDATLPVLWITNVAFLLHLSYYFFVASYKHNRYKWLGPNLQKYKLNLMFNRFSNFCRTQEGPAYTWLFNFHMFARSLGRSLGLWGPILVPTHSLRDKGKRDNTGTWEHRNTGHRNTGTQEHRNTGTQEHRNTGTQEHGNLGTQKLENTETWEHGNLGTRKLGNTET